MNEHERSQLTPDGEARREAMLDELVGTMQRVHHGRRVRRRVGSTLAVLTIFAGIAWVIGLQLSAGDRGGPEIVIRQPLQQLPELIAPEPRIRMVNDAELVALLVQLDRPAGIVRSEGKTWLTNAVTDAELGLTFPEPVDPSTM